MTRADRIIGSILAAVYLAFVILWAVAVSVLPAKAHGPAEWIQSGKYKNAAGELCCGEVDCGEKIAGTVEARADGYHVNATFRITAPTGTVVTEEVHEIVPYHKVQPSPQRKYLRRKQSDRSKGIHQPAQIRSSQQTHKHPYPLDISTSTARFSLRSTIILR
jgi:hypothetical protein